VTRPGTALALAVLGLAGLLAVQWFVTSPGRTTDTEWHVMLLSAVPRLHDRAVCPLDCRRTKGPMVMTAPYTEDASVSGHTLTSMFASYGNDGPWTGGDSTASVLLADGRTAWLFSDTMLGRVHRERTRDRDTPMVHNSIVVQDGYHLDTIVAGTFDEPRDLIPAPTAGEWCWIGSALADEITVQVLVNTYRQATAGQFGFELTGTALIHLDPTTLRPRRGDPLNLGDRIAWGSALLDALGHTYIYGSEFIATSGERRMHVARVARGMLAGRWEFFTGSRWSLDLEDSVPVLSGVGTAFGVQKVGRRYALITVDCRKPFSDAVVAYTAGKPAGTWSGPRLLHTAEEPWIWADTIIYDARVHPHLASSGDVLVSYNVHSTDPEMLFEDVRVYRPRFFERPSEHIR
jgi:hypothetical protein